MKFFLLLVVTVSFASANDDYYGPDEYKHAWDETIKPYVEECAKESGFVIDKSFFNLFKRNHFPNTPEFKCFFKCIDMRMNLMDEKGNVNKELILEKIKGVDVHTLDECELLVRNETDLCEKAYSGLLCGMHAIYKKYEHNFFIPDEYRNAWNERKRPYAEECAKESGYVTDTSNFKLFKHNLYPNTPKFKCFMKCLLVRTNCMDEKGNFNKTMLESVQGADVNNVDECVLLLRNETDICEKAYQTPLCIMKAIHKKHKPETN